MISPKVRTQTGLACQQRLSLGKLITKPWKAIRKAHISAFKDLCLKIISIRASET